MKPRANDNLTRTKCPGCGRDVQIKMSKKDLAYQICSAQNPETLEPCYTRVFYGREATAKLIDAWRRDQARPEPPPRAREKPEPEPEPIEPDQEGGGDDLLF